MNPPAILLHGDEIRFHMFFRSDKPYDRLINSVRSFIRSKEDREGKSGTGRELIPLRIEMPEENICKGDPDIIHITHIKMAWKKFAIREDEVLIVELTVESKIYHREIASSYIINIRKAEDDYIYFVDPGYNFHDN